MLFDCTNDTDCKAEVVLACGDAEFTKHTVRFIVENKKYNICLRAVYTVPGSDNIYRENKDVISFKTVDAAEITREIQTAPYCILLLGTDLPGADSLKIAEDLYCLGLSENIIVISDFFSSLHKSAFSKMNIGYYFVLPVEPELLCRRICECRKLLETEVNNGCITAQESGSNTCEKDMRRRTTHLLHEIGIPANLCGHEYLREAVLMVANENEVYGKMTKIVYPSIAEKYSKSSSSVEKAIRTALDVAWMRGKTDLLDEIFGFTVNIQKGKPTNSEFIALLADYVVSGA